MKKGNDTISLVMKGSNAIQIIKKGLITVYEAFKNLLVSGIPPLTLLGSKGKNLVDYKLYGNSVQNGTPTPDTPIEVESVGEKTKNLVNIPDIEVGASNVTIPCNLTQTFAVSCQEYPTLIANDNGVEKSIWRLSFTYLDGSITYITDEVLKGIVGSRYLHASEENPIVSITIRSTYVRDGKYGDFQLEYGITPTEYEPYGYKIPVKASGKNLYQESTFTSSNGITIEYNPDTHIYTLNGTTVTAGNIWLSNKFVPDVKVGEDVTLTSEIVSGTIDRNGQYIFYSIFNAKNTSYIRNTDGYYLSKPGKVIKTAKMISGEYMHYCVQVGGKGVTFNNVQIRVQLEKGTKSTSYEPYIGPAKLTNIYLDEPLRKVGEYADYIDFVNSKVVRNIGTKIFNGTESWIAGTTTTAGAYRYNVNNIITPKSINLLCSHFVQGSVNSSEQVGRIGIHGNFSAGYVAIFADISTLTEFKTWLSENNTELIYILATPIEETIELPNIPTLKGTTILSIDTTIQPSNLEVTYKGK